MTLVRRMLQIRNRFWFFEQFCVIHNEVKQAAVLPTLFGAQRWSCATIPCCSASNEWSTLDAMTRDSVGRWSSSRRPSSKSFRAPSEVESEIDVQSDVTSSPSWRPARRRCLSLYHVCCSIVLVPTCLCSAGFSPREYPKHQFLR